VYIGTRLLLSTCLLMDHVSGTVCLKTSVCLITDIFIGRPFAIEPLSVTVCPVCNVGVHVLWRNDWMDQDATWTISDAIFPLPDPCTLTPNVHSLCLWKYLIACPTYNVAKSIAVNLDYRISGRRHSPGLYSWTLRILLRPR